MMQLKSFGSVSWKNQSGPTSNNVVPFTRPGINPDSLSYPLILAGLTLAIAGCLIVLTPLTKARTSNLYPSQPFSAADFARALRRL